MKKTFLILIALGALAGTPAQAARRVPVEDRIDVPLLDADRNPLNLAESRRAILAGARMRDWKVKADEPGLIRLEYTYRRGNAGATVDLPYKAGSYSIIYSGSYGLAERQNGTVRSVKSGYLQWIRNLAHDIDMAALRGGDSQPGSPRQQDAADGADDKEEK